MTIHEFAHNYVAHRMGDPVPKQLGRLTLNPFVHINWMGWLMFAFIGFGILGSAPIAPHRMRNPRWGFMAAVAAGPLSNLALAIFTALIMRLLGPSFLVDLPQFIWLFLVQMVILNLVLFVFNLIPLFPLDGWHIVLSLLPGYLLHRNQIPDMIRKNVRPLSAFLQQPAYTWQRWQMVSYYILIALIFLSLAQSYTGGLLPDLLGGLIGPPISFLFGLMVGFPV